MIPRYSRVSLFGLTCVEDVLVRIEEGNDTGGRSEVEIKNSGNIPRLTLSSGNGQVMGWAPTLHWKHPHNPRQDMVQLVNEDVYCTIEIYLVLPHLSPCNHAMHAICQICNETKFNIIFMQVSPICQCPLHQNWTWNRFDFLTLSPYL
jgi:hypothetical protein